jgi:hypothetical protein
LGQEARHFAKSARSDEISERYPRPWPRT